MMSDELMFVPEKNNNTLENKKEEKVDPGAFVHNEHIFEAVKSLGIDYTQGYFFGEPKPELI